MHGSTRTAFVGGTVLTPEGVTRDAAVVVEGDAIVTVGAGAGAAHQVDARGLWVLPGIVDLHGDAFERQIMPRPGVHFDLRLALADTDRQLVGNGITTAFHAVTCSWEPGLRSRAATRALVEALDAARPHLACDTRLHLRHETYNLDGADEAAAWLVGDKIGLLAFNDHTPDMVAKRDDAQEMATYLQRTGLSAEAFDALLARVAARHGEVEASVGRLAAVARAAGVPMASHDDPSPAVRRRYHEIGCAVAEFPKTRETAALARELGDHIVFGSPNVVRGGSHKKHLVGAAAMAADGLCTVLTSDYYYPALLPAPFCLARDGVCGFAAAWDLVSANPADAAGLRDRGRLAPGLRADLLLVEAPDDRPPRVAATVVAGQFAYIGKPAPRVAL